MYVQEDQQAAQPAALFNFSAVSSPASHGEITPIHSNQLSASAANDKRLTHKRDRYQVDPSESIHLRETEEVATESLPSRDHLIDNFGETTDPKARPSSPLQQQQAEERGEAPVGGVLFDGQDARAPRGRGGVARAAKRVRHRRSDFDNINKVNYSFMIHTIYFLTFWGQDKTYFPCLAQPLPQA